MFSTFKHVVHRIEQLYDRAKWKVRRRLGISPITLVAYDGYGNASRLTVLGRVVADYSVTPATEADTIWQNIVNMIRRFRSHEIPRARVAIAFRDQTVEIQTDVEGHFRATINLPAGMINRDVTTPDATWHAVTLTLVDPPGPSTGPFVAQVIVPAASAEFGVISDLDDTVIQTDVLSVIQAARNTFLHNAYSRLAFSGVAEFYGALQQGTGAAVNPIFYVSNMPWNLYDLMHDFFEIRDIPRGPMFLTDLGITDAHLLRPSGHDHKLGQITELLTTYPDLPFILIGDAGEEDPVIYVDALERYPDRIKAIYIRDVPGNENEAAITELIVRAAQLDVDLLLVPDTLAAAQHAADQGFITAEAVERVRAEIVVEELE